MTNYYRTEDGFPSPQQNHTCALEPDGIGGQRLLVDGLVILRLRENGAIDRPAIEQDLADHRGLLLNDEGKVICD